MGSYRQIYYHIVFGTKYRQPTIAEAYCEELYKYISGTIENKKSKLYRINGVEDHIHILSDLHPSISLADFVKDIKVSTSIWMKENGKFPAFTGWQEGYGAFTCSVRSRDRIINYIKNQKEHHKKKSFIDEYKSLLTKHEIEFDERYLL
ncbi:MAG: IS200/IS605 family transposase [Cyclobacteriaceae bacterium]|nr:IS200/IS605 family transposase [Cyclobacteriaceae bacterium]